MASLIGNCMISEECLLRVGVWLNKVFSIALIVYFICALAKYPSTPANLGVGITYIIFESLAKFDTLLFVLFLALSPILLVIICLVALCSKQGQQSRVQ